MCYYYLFCQLRRKFNANDRSGGSAFLADFVGCGGSGTILRPEKIVQDSQAGAVYEWTDCRLLENRIGYVKLECDNPYRKNKGGRRDILEYTIEREGYEEGTLMVRRDWMGSVSYYTIKDPDYGREAEPAAKADEGNGESDILII